MQAPISTINAPPISLYVNLPSTKMIGSIILAAMITFLLFFMMHKLTHQNSIVIVEPSETFIPDVFLQDHLDSPIKIKNLLPEQPKMMEQPKPVKIQPETLEEVTVSRDFAIGQPTLIMHKSLAEFTTAGNDARPIIRVSPRYPIDASRQGIEGWVQLEFTIDSSGTVKNVKVTDSEPKRVFDSEAKRALRKWKYKPQMVDGRATDLPKMQVVLDFKLDS